jgi:type 1 glutamine amidotransferase
MKLPIALLLTISAHAFAQAPPKNVAPPPRSRQEVEAILQKAPKSDRPLKPLSILLIAGPKDHGPGEHDYPRWQKEWAPLMSKADNVKITTAFPWPKPEQWDGVDLAVFFLKTKWDASQLADIKKLQDRGAGVVTIHWAIGCDQEWDNHAQRFGLSYRAASFRHGKVNLKIAATDHPIFLGMPKEMQFVDEPYWPFIGDKSNINILATSDEMIERGDDRGKNPGSDRVETIPVFWAYEPKDTKGRVFVTIFGHYMWTFDDPFFRLMLLRGMGWAAKDDVYRFDKLAIEGVELAK